MKQFLIGVAAASLLLFSPYMVFAEQIPNENANSNAFEIPEKSGDYPDPEHPGVRVRVFVHQTKGSTAITCEDPKSTAVDGVLGWHLSPTVTYHLNTSSAPSSVGSNFSTIAGNAFNTWQTAVGSSKVTFGQGSDTSANRQALDFQNIVAFGRTSGSALAVTYTRYYTLSHEVADVDTIFNKKFTWAWTDPSINTCSLYPSSYDVQDILTHELGHWMGLNDQYDGSYSNNTMFGYGSQGEIKKDTLTTGDIIPLSSIYH